jgi:hypothetical protein
VSIRSLHTTLFAVLFAALLSSCSPQAPTPLKPLTQGELVEEPTPAARFMEAFRRGDEASAEGEASPLYREEWARRKISLSERQMWLPDWFRKSDSGTTWLTVNYVDGFVDTDGLGHLLYLGHSGNERDNSTPSVWRLDTDQSGRVTWAEMVWLFSEPMPTVLAVSGSTAGTSAEVPPAFLRMHPQFVVGVHSSRNWEGYYAVWHTAGDHQALNFFAIDEAGYIRPGVWTYRMT